MSRGEELTLKIIDGTATSEDMDELEWVIASDDDEMARHIALLQVESVLRGQRQDLDLADHCLAALKRSLTQPREQPGVLPEAQSLESEDDFPDAFATPPEPGRAAVARTRSRRRRRSGTPVMLYVLFFLVLGAVVGGYFYREHLLSQAGEPEHTALVTERDGRVIIHRSTGRMRAEINSPMDPGESIETDTNSFAVLQFAGDVRIRLRSSSSAILAGASDVATTHRRVRVIKGRAEVKLTLDDESHPFSLYTDHAQIDAQAANYHVVVTGTGTRVGVTGGAARVTNTFNGRSIEVPSGHTTLVQGGGQPLAITALADAPPDDPADPVDPTDPKDSIGTPDPKPFTGPITWTDVAVVPFMGDMRGDVFTVRGEPIRVRYQVDRLSPEAGAFVVRLHSIDNPDVVEDIVELSDSGKGEWVSSNKTGSFRVDITASRDFMGEITIQRAQRE